MLALGPGLGLGESSVLQRELGLRLALCRAPLLDFPLFVSQCGTEPFVLLGLLFYRGAVGVTLLYRVASLVLTVLTTKI